MNQDASGRLLWDKDCTVEALAMIEVSVRREKGGAMRYSVAEDAEGWLD